MLHAVGVITGLATFPIRPVIFIASYTCTVTEDTCIGRGPAPLFFKDS